MRALGLGDVVAAARGVAGLPPEAARARVALWCAQAHAADKWRKRTGRVHPRFGHGSLAGRAGQGMPPPPVNGAGDLAALAAAVAGCMDWRAAQARRAGADAKSLRAL